MDSRRAKSAFAFVALSAMLASAAPAGAQPAPAPAAGPISDAQFQKVLAMMHGARSFRGKPTDLAPNVANALGLGNDGKAAVAGRIVITDKQGMRYQMSLLSEGKGYLLIRHGGSGTRIFLMDANRSLVAGLAFEGNQYPSTLPAEDAQKFFREDLGAWARIADAYSPAKAP